MFGVRFLKAPPTTYVIQYKNGQVVREGSGLSFFYFAPGSEIINVPLTSSDVPFVFSEVTADYQDVTIQGELTYRVQDAKRLASILDFSVDAVGRFRSQDPTKLNDRLIHAAQNHARSFTQRNKLRELLTSSDALIAEIVSAIQESEVTAMLGVEVLGFSILAIKPTPEMAKAFQADAREELLRKADEAVYARRNAAVELERQIKENELNTEIAVEHKKRQVRETQMAAEIAVEEQRASFVDYRVTNERKEADARAYGLRVTLEPLKAIDWRILMAVAGNGDPKHNVALAFRELAENAGKIGTLNITPDLLEGLISERAQKGEKQQGK